MAPESRNITTRPLQEFGIGLSDVKNFLFEANILKPKQIVWMTTPIPGATQTFLNQIPKFQAAGYEVFLSVSNSESILMVNNTFKNKSPISNMDIVPVPDILFLSGGETSDFSIDTIKRFRLLRQKGTIVFQEDIPGSMGTTIEFANKPENTIFLPDLLLTPTRSQGRQYRKMLKDKPTHIFVTGNPALDVLPSDKPLTQKNISELKSTLGINERDIVIYIVGKPAQDMSIPEYINMPEHEKLSEELSGRRDINTFFLAYALQSIEAFRIKYKQQIGGRSISVLYRPHPRDLENIQEILSPVEDWFKNNYSKSALNIISKTTTDWNKLCRADDLFWLANSAIFFDSSLVDRLIIDLVARKSKLDKKQKTNIPEIAYPIIFHPHVALYVPFIHRRIEDERMFSTSFTRYKEALTDNLLPDVIFDRKKTEKHMMESMRRLAFEYKKLTSRGNWNIKNSSDLVLLAVQSLDY